MNTIFPGVPDKKHSDLKRIKSLCKARKTNLISIDKEKQCAVFAGSQGEVYQTDMLSCPCGSGSRPCKHMYRLAMELGIIDITAEPWKTYSEYEDKLKRARNDLGELTLPNLTQAADYIDELKNHK